MKPQKMEDFLPTMNYPMPTLFFHGLQYEVDHSLSWCKKRSQ